MKRFILHIVTFSIFALLLLIVLDVLISIGLRKSEDSLMYGINVVMNDTINADILILGNSRAMCAYNTRILEDSMNCKVIDLGASGQPFESSYLRYKLYKKKNIKPKLIILNTDFYELREYDHGFNREQFYPYIINRQFHSILRKNQCSPLDLCFPMYRYLGHDQLITQGFSELFSISHAKEGYHGYYNVNTAWDGRHLATLLDGGEKVECFYDSDVVSLLDSFFIDTQKDSIPVLMVYAPLCKRVIELLEEPDSVYNVYNSFSVKYSVPIDNHLNMFYDSDTLFFYNGNHINLKGSEIFTNQLIHDIDSLHLMR